MNTSHQILIIGPSWVGDMVMAQSLFRLLKSQNPECLIDVLAPAWALPLIERMPEIHQGITMPVGHGKIEIRKRYQLGKSLRDNYSQAIVLPNSLKSALIPFFAKIKKRTGWIGEVRYGLLNDFRKLDKSKLTMTVQRFAALAYPQSHEQLPEILPPELAVKKDNVISALTKHSLQQRDSEKTLILCPGAEFGLAKQWPATHYAELSRHYLSKSWQVWLLGSEKDEEICAEINELCDHQCSNLSGKTSLAEAVDLMSIADAVASNDSGLMHVAAALNRPLVAIYGSTDPSFTPPLNAEHRIVSKNLPCSPCFQRECPLNHMDCMNKLTSDEVINAFKEMDI